MPIPRLHSLSTVLTTLVIVVCASVRPISAQTPLGLELSPPVTHVIIKPGTQARQPLRLKNTGTDTVTITPTAVDFSANNSSGHPNLSDTFSFSYLGFDDGYQLDTPFSLAAGEEKILTLVFSIPSSEREQEYHFVLLFRAIRQESSLTSTPPGTTIRSDIGSTFLVTLSQTGATKSKMVLDTLDFSPFIDSFGGIHPQVFFRNEGKTVGSVSGSLKIFDVFGTQQYIAEFFPTYVLPQSRREVLAHIIPTAIGPQELGSSSKFQWKPLILIGPYRVVVEYTNSSGELTTQSVTVVALPFTILLVVLISGTIKWLYTSTPLFSRRERGV